MLQSYRISDYWVAKIFLGDLGISLVLGKSIINKTAKQSLNIIALSWRFALPAQVLTKPLATRTIIVIIILTIDVIIIA